MFVVVLLFLLFWWHLRSETPQFWAFFCHFRVPLPRLISVFPGYMRLQYSFDAELGISGYFLRLRA
jgi:hypothetical protein